MMQRGIDTAAMIASYVPLEYQSWVAYGLIAITVILMGEVSGRMYDAAFGAAFQGGGFGGFFFAGYVPTAVSLGCGAVMTYVAVSHSFLVGVIFGLAPIVIVLLLLLIVGLVDLAVQEIKFRLSMRKMRNSLN